MQLYIKNPEEKHIFYCIFHWDWEREGHRERQIALTGESERRKFTVALCVENHTVVLQCLKCAEPQVTSEELRAKTVNCCFGCILSGAILLNSVYSSYAIYYKYVTLPVHVICFESQKQFGSLQVLICRSKYVQTFRLKLGMIWMKIVFTFISFTVSQCAAGYYDII